MNRIPVESSNLKSIGYDPEQQILEIEFRGNVVWQYRNVPMSVWLELESAPSKGKYFQSQIRERFASTGYRVS